jgi:glucokinase
MIIEFDEEFCTESSTTWPRLLGDIGGTNARFAWQVHEGAPIDQVMVMSCADHSDVVKAVEHYLTSRHLHRPKAVALGMAVPVVSDFIELTNNHWKLSIKETRAALEVSTLLVLNDFTALALAIPGLEDKDKHQIGTGNPRDWSRYWIGCFWLDASPRSTSMGADSRRGRTCQFECFQPS